MPHLNFRIGTKLGISAAVAVVFVIGMLINQVLVIQATHHANSVLRVSETVRKLVLEAEIDIRKLLIMQREMRSSS